MKCHIRSRSCVLDIAVTHFNCLLYFSFLFFLIAHTTSALFFKANSIVYSSADFSCLFLSVPTTTTSRRQCVSVSTLCFFRNFWLTIFEYTVVKLKVYNGDIIMIFFLSLISISHLFDELLDVQWCDKLTSSFSPIIKVCLKYPSNQSPPPEALISAFNGICA